MDYSGKLNGLYTESHTGRCFPLYRSGENKLKGMGMGKQGEPCRDVACYVWEQGEQGELGKLTQNYTLPVHTERSRGVPCSLFPEK